MTIVASSLRKLNIQNPYLTLKEAHTHKKTHDCNIDIDIE
jgi:hypothetical protein